MFRGGWASFLMAYWMVGSPAGAAENPPLEPLVVFEHDELVEASGLIKSRRFEGIYWTHTDSGGKPKIYAINHSGEVVADFRIAGADNGDWEDIAIDHDGHLYIGDIGNNMGLFRARFIYKVKEPDPNSEDSRTITPLAKLKYRYIGDERFDAESLIWHRGRLYVISKPRGRRPSLYVLDPTEETNVLSPRKLADLSTRMPCAADVSEDGSEMLICTRSEIWVYPVDENLVPISGGNSRHVWYPRTAMEGCCFDGKDVAMLSEDRRFFRVSRSQIDAGINFRDPILDEEEE
jgi:hypothetical protein